MVGRVVRQEIETGSVDWQEVVNDGIFASIIAGISSYLYGVTVKYPYSSVSSTSCTVADDVANIADDTVPVSGEITGYTTHGYEQAIGRDGGRGVASDAILDAVQNPVQIVPQVGELWDNVQIYWIACSSCSK